MTDKAAFTGDEWNLLREGPPTAGMIVLTASKGGSFRETWALAKSFAEARQKGGESELLDALAAEKPELKRYGSPDELEQQGLAKLGEAVELLTQKATPDEVEDYRRFTLEVAGIVAEAHREEGESVSENERQAIEKIETSMNRS
jgi:hypothetical protein